jgi:hypothetical protein
MLEEKNDNLHDADGNVSNESQQVTIAENQEETEHVSDSSDNQLAELSEVITEVEQAAIEGFDEPALEIEVALNEDEQLEVTVLTETLTEDEIEVATEKEALVEEAVKELLNKNPNL